MEDSERESTPDNSLVDSPHPPDAPHPTLEVEEDNAAKLREYDRLSALARKGMKD